MIDTEKDNRKLVERAILIGIDDKLADRGTIAEHLDELEELVGNLNIPVIDKQIVKIQQPQVKYYLGSGKAEEIKELIVSKEADCLIFDCELSPSQQRNWERLTKICVIDRQEVILDIFASRASTREAVLQVELARMQYSLPRLARAWMHLSRQRGGAKGTRGEGEKQLEVDRRLVQQRISSLKKELTQVRKHRNTQRKNRYRSELAHGAIVGYTNAGKSSLLNALSGSEVLVEDKLFATLDPTTRKVELAGKQPILLTDTVGFVRKLPHSLVEAFKSTLEEAVLADFLILVLDISSPSVEEHWETTLGVLKELGADDKRIITVFNKTDLDIDEVRKVRIRSLFPDALYISVRRESGLEQLKQHLEKYVSTGSERMKLLLPPRRHDLIAKAHEYAQILDSYYDDTGNLHLTVNINSSMRKQFEEFAEL